MRLWLAAVLICLAGSVTPPAAAQDDPDFSVRVTSCIAAAGGEEAKLVACKGAASQPCMETDGGASTWGMVMCLGAEEEAWGALMQGTLTRLSSAHPETSQALARAQEQWQGFRDAECDYRVVRWGEGTGARVVRASCFSNFAADRAIALIVTENELE